MIRLNVIVEGQTEETYLRDSLAPYLGSLGIYACARSVQTGQKKGKVFRGGLGKYGKAKKDILTWAKQDPEAYFTTMFDLYALPDDFPGKAEADGFLLGLGSRLA
ncbi:MAG: DUF4276 family protein [Desulfitobacteriaceae bacterium]